jgi:glycosyltransferase involved in cell wall biosynthesis
MIGFVIPSIGRETLKYSLRSLLNQTDSNWKCWVGFDGKSEGEVDESILIEDERINYLYFSEKKGQSAHHGNAGLVRNSIISNISDDCEWIGFLDDDDTLSKFYIELLKRERIKQQFDCCVFRMRYDSENKKVIPPFGMNQIIQNYVGISFAVNKKFLLDNDLKFENNNAEDFLMLKQIQNKGKIHISSHICYNVNGHTYG